MFQIRKPSPRSLRGSLLALTCLASLLIYARIEAQAQVQTDIAKLKFAQQLIHAARDRTRKNVTYDGRYISIPYPNGDVPDNIGVCTDVVVRSYRKLGIDLQVKVHMDMKRAFSKYPKRWGLKRPDPNIDHRRVPNLQTFFTRHGQKLTVSKKPEDYKPGALVTWLVGGNLPHIGIVSDKMATDGKTPLIIHNIGSGPVEDNILFAYKITGHYLYQP